MIRPNTCPISLGFLLLLLAGCSSNDARPVLRLATTTSTRDSGLLDELLPRFEQQTLCRVDVVAVGTGAALKLGEAGDTDVLLVHAPDAELEFVRAGHGTRRETFMVNYFTLLGPDDDPARVRDVSASDSLRTIASSGERFVSRGDDSGTHKKELALWRQAGGRPMWSGYLESGQGMGATLLLADEKRAYTLTDEGTYWKFHNKLDLVPLVDRSDELRNPYSVISVNPTKHPKINATLANAFADFLLDESTQRAIADYRIEGRALFEPTRSNERD